MVSFDFNVWYSNQFDIVQVSLKQCIWNAAYYVVPKDTKPTGVNDILS